MSAPFNLLIVEDDAQLAATLKLIVPDSFKIYVTQSPDLIPNHVFFHAALVDMHLSTEVGQSPDGLKVMTQLHQTNPQTEIVAMSGDLNRENMEASLKAGAQRFLAKPLSPEEVLLIFEKILAYWQLRLTHLSPQITTRLIGSSETTENLRKKIASLKNESSAILIEGETGSGKEVIAQLLNQQQGKVPFVALNCAALNENLFESEFFGHVKGSFTGADQNKIGLAEAAHGGDLFLDEIEALPLSQQAKLLRFLESGEIRKVGAKDTIKVQTRIIAASNQSLKKMVDEKKFREDLYFRISSQKINIPALRERKNDIAELCQYFIEQNKPFKNKTFAPETIEILKSYSWPGNVRELKRVCEQLSLTSALPMIRSSEVEQLLRVSNPSTQSLNDYLQTQEKEYLDFHLKREKNLDTLCLNLQISKSNLYKKIKDYGLNYE